MRAGSPHLPEAAAQGSAFSPQQAERKPEGKGEGHSCGTGSWHRGSLSVPIPIPLSLLNRQK